MGVESAPNHRFDASHPAYGSSCEMRFRAAKGTRCRVIAQILEAVMLLCFGLSWPTNAYKCYKAETAAGTSWQFILLITAGYFAGIAAKIIAGQINWVLAIYFLNLIFLAGNWAVYFRNRRLDTLRLEGKVPA
jgi:hypothetical protein